MVFQLYLQVFPSKLEYLLQENEAVDDAVVVGIPDKEAGELPCAMVVIKPGKSITEKQLQDWVAGNGLSHLTKIKEEYLTCSIECSVC